VGAGLLGFFAADLAFFSAAAFGVADLATGSLTDFASGRVVDFFVRFNRRPLFAAIFDRTGSLTQSRSYGQIRLSEFDSLAVLKMSISAKSIQLAQ